MSELLISASYPPDHTKADSIKGRTIVNVVFPEFESGRAFNGRVIFELDDGSSVEIYGDSMETDEVCLVIHS